MEGIVPMMRRPFDGSATLYWMLIGLVLFSFMAPIFILVTQFPLLYNLAPAWLLNVLALALLVVTFKPVWHWVQPRVHHVVYAADDPNIDVIGQMSDALVSTTVDSSMLAAIAETITQTMSVPYVQIEAFNGTAAVVGTPRKAGVRTRIELIYQDISLGWLETMSRLPNEPLTTGEYRLLHSLARQVSITLHAAQLSNALQTAREQLVLAREEERRRIRRNLHDGLGPTLAALRLQLGAVRHLVRENPDEAERLLDELRSDVRDATAEIRRLVYDLRPPMLDEFGLVGALRNLQLTDTHLVRMVEAPEPLPPLPAAVEVALYRIAAEAMHNIVRHAEADSCVIQLDLTENAITLSVSDNGCGLPPTYLVGVGHRSMRERAAELGGSVAVLPVPSGGTCVRATFPLQVARNG